jgi:hypothetical protein
MGISFGDIRVYAKCNKTIDTGPEFGFLDADGVWSELKEAFSQGRAHSNGEFVKQGV